jgi:hypothetical protein
MYHTQQELPVRHDNYLMFSRAHPKQLYLILLLPIPNVPIPILLARGALCDSIVLADLPCRYLTGGRPRE